jgi:hypothetical protein
MVKEIWKSFFHRLPASAKHMVKEILEILFPSPSRQREAHGEGDFGKSFFHRLPASAKHMVRSL